MRLTYYPILAEIKEEYIRLRQNAKSRTEATEILIQHYQNEIVTGQDDDGLLFWIGLADAQYNKKELTVEIANKALQALQQIEICKWDISPGDISRRKEHYAKAPMSEKKIRKSRTKFHCSWDIGDVFSYRLTANTASELGIAGGYMLYQKIDEAETFDGRIIPVVTLGFCEESKYPCDGETYLRIPHMRLAASRFSEAKRKYEYRAHLYIDSAKQLSNSSIQFLGNYPVRNIPNDETEAQYEKILPLAVLEMLSCAFWKVDRFFRDQQQE